MGNQQYALSGLYFSNVKNALQLHWDWGWTIQNIVIDNADTGVTIVRGAGGVSSATCPPSILGNHFGDWAKD